ncbi:hypothetical protein C2S52_012058 [Perilla frutescens var. hirtella]|nr:hypothetical protein C2S52_012058 [Perilla frutescens var. hirtella]
MESSSDPTPPWDPKYHFEALSKHFQRQHQALSDKIDDLVHAFERTKTTPTITQTVRGPARRNECPNEPEEEYYDENTDAGYDTPDRGRHHRRAAHNDDYGEERMLNNIKTSIPEFEGLHDPDIYLDWERKLTIRESLRRSSIRSEYHKELETVLNRVGKEETLNATIIRYIEDMNPDIACEVELKDFTSVERIVQYASIVEKKLREGRRRSHQSSAPTRHPWNKGTHSTSPSTPSSESTRSRVPPPRPPFQWPNQSNTMPNAAPSRARDIQCHKCQGWGHFQNQCPNRCLLFLNEQNGLESASEDEEEPQATAPDTVDVPKVEQDDEETELLHVSLVSIHGLNINREDEDGSVINAISQYAVDKLALTTTKHPKPYKLQWLTDRGSIRVTGHYSDTVLCDVIPMEAAHILLGRPWQFDRQAVHDGLANTYSITRDGRTTVFKPLTPKSIAEDQERMQKIFKQERAKTAAAVARTNSAATSPPYPTTSSTNTAPKPPSNDSLVHGKASGSAPRQEKNRSLFISVKGVEKVLKAGPITRLRANKLQDYLQATIHKKLEEEDGVQGNSPIHIEGLSETRYLKINLKNLALCTFEIQGNFRVVIRIYNSHRRPPPSTSSSTTVVHITPSTRS